MKRPILNTIIKQSLSNIIYWLLSTNIMHYQTSIAITKQHQAHHPTPPSRSTPRIARPPSSLRIRAGRSVQTVPMPGHHRGGRGLGEGHTKCIQGGPLKIRLCKFCFVYIWEGFSIISSSYVKLMWLIFVVFVTYIKRGSR